MMRYLRVIVFLFLAYLILSSVTYFLDVLKERRSKEYLPKISRVEFDQIENVSVVVRESACLKNVVNIGKDDYGLFLTFIQSSLMMPNQNDRLSPIEIFEFNLSMKNAEPICFLLFNSKKYGGVIRFFNDCESTTKALDASNSDLLDFVHSKCRK